MPDNYGTNADRLILVNTYCFSTATMVTRIRLTVTLYVHYLSVLFNDAVNCQIKRHWRWMDEYGTLTEWCWQRKTKLAQKKRKKRKKKENIAVPLCPPHIPRKVVWRMNPDVRSEGLATVSAMAWPWQFVESDGRQQNLAPSCTYLSLGNYKAQCSRWTHEATANMFM